MEYFSEDDATPFGICKLCRVVLFTAKLAGGDHCNFSDFCRPPDSYLAPLRIGNFKKFQKITEN